MTAFYMMRQNSQDGYCVKEVIVDNEYRLPDRFPAGAVVIDLGANIGCFALACLGRGAEVVDCYEPEWENFKLLKHNISQARHDASMTGRATLNQEAVWSSRGVAGITSSGEPFTAMFRTLPVPPTDTGFTIPMVTMADILAKHDAVELVKLDVEGAELPIINGWARDLGANHRVRSVCGEVHYEIKVAGYDYKPNRAWLETVLPMLGFPHIEIASNRESGGMVGHFWAHR